jgi:chlorite dismutase
MTKFGRTYAIGHEQDMEDWLLKKPRRNVFDPKNTWAVWYPLRRKPEFETLTKEEQRPILMEHAKLGMAYGAADLANDVRLACYGLDAHDNEFVLGVVGRELHPLSALIQEMRKTQQTMKYIQSLGPFFIGSVAGRSQQK